MIVAELERLALGRKADGVAVTPLQQA